MSFHQDWDINKYQAAEPARPDEIESGVVISADTRRENRLPPGQTRTRKWPVLDAFGPPQIDLTKWSLRIFGLVERELTFSLPEFHALPQVRLFADFHCVTRWSRLGNIWAGVSTRELLNRAGLKPAARFVVCHAYDNDWTTNLPLADFLAEDALLAVSIDEAHKQQTLQRIEHEIEEAIEFAERSPHPDPSEVLEDVYAPL